MDTSGGTEIKRAIQEWFNKLEQAVNSTDYDFAKENLFAEDVVSFGTKASEVMRGVQNLATQQWCNVWPNIKDFAFDNNLHLLVSGNQACAIITWQSQGVLSDGSGFHRPGRATVLFEQRGGQWLAVHTHFSLIPAT